VLALTSAASLMVSLDIQVVATALPAIRLHLHASLAALEWTAWPWIFWLNVPIGLIMIPLILARIPAADPANTTQGAERARTSLDPVGLVLATGGALGIVWALIRSDSLGGVAICAAVFAAHGGYASSATFAAGFGPAMGACAGLALLGAAAGLVIPGRRQPTSATPPTPVQSDAPKIETRR